MYKLARVSMTYMIIGLLSGIFFREFTRANSFTGETQLSVLHTHTLILGMFFFLIVLLLEKSFKLTENKKFKTFYILYNAGLGLTLLMLIINGSMTVLGMASHPAIAGMAGLGHIIITIGLGYFFYVLLAQIKTLSK